MAILSDRDIKTIIREKDAVYVKGKDKPDLNFDLQLGPSSFDLRLGNEFGILNTRKVEMIDTKNMQNYDRYIHTETHSAEEGVVIHPGEFILGGTLETLNIPDNLVARVEGRSSYGRLGIIVHASLPYEEKILFHTEEEGYEFKEIGKLVENEENGKVVGFNPETQKTELFPVTDFIENPPKDIYRVKTKRGREVKVTQDHNMFTLNEDGEIERVKTQNLEGERVAVPKKIPASQEDSKVDLVELFERKDLEEDIMVSEKEVVDKAELENTGMRAYYNSEDTVPLPQVDAKTGQEARLSFKQSSAEHPREIELTSEFAYAAGLFIAEGHQRRKYLSFSNRNEKYLERVKDYFKQFDVGFYEKTDETGCKILTISSAFFSRVFKALGIADKRIQGEILDMPEKNLEKLYQGLIDGDASVRDGRIEYYTSKKSLAGDIAYLCSMLGKAASITHREREDGRDEYRVEISENPHKMLQRVPTPTELLRDTRQAVDISGKRVASELGYSSKTSIHNLESGYYETVKRKSLEKIGRYYINRAKTSVAEKKAEKILKIARSDLYFDKVVEVEKIAEQQPNYDLEVQPEGKKIENFLGGHGGIFLSNTAGYCDPGFEGDITLEMQNLGNAPVKLYPEDRICQVVFETMTSEAETPYGDKTDNKYMGQSGATGSKLEKEER